MQRPGSCLSYCRSARTVPNRSDSHPEACSECDRVGSARRDRASQAPLSQRDNNNLQPRIGLAWHPRPRWVFRTGFGLNTIDVKYPNSRIQFEERGDQ